MCPLEQFTFERWSFLGIRTITMLRLETLEPCQDQNEIGWSQFSLQTLHKLHIAPKAQPYQTTS